MLECWCFYGWVDSGLSYVRLQGVAVFVGFIRKPNSCGAGSSRLGRRRQLSMAQSPSDTILRRVHLECDLVAMIQAFLDAPMPEAR